MAQELTALDLDVRRRVYDTALSRSTIPRKSDLAHSTGTTQEEVATSLRRLADAHMLVLQPENGEILMANPFSAVPTPFLVRSGSRSWYGNCIWDAMGIAAMIHNSAMLEASCGCCGSAIALAMPADLRDGDERVAHFAIPAARWWDDIVFN